MESYYGKLSPECLQELDSLLLELKELNAVHGGKRVIRRTEIVPLPDDKYLKLWGYLTHCCKLASNWDNVKQAINTIASRTNRSFKEVQEECVLSMTIHAYTYAWRHYEHSEDCGYVFRTATFGYRAWIEEQNNSSTDGSVKMEDENVIDRGHKICTLNLDK